MNNLITSYKNLRKAIGWLGMALPFILPLGNWCINRFDVLNNSTFVCTNPPWQCYRVYEAAGSWKGSVSHYYYTSVGELFTGLLTAVALFMFCYKGHPLRHIDKLKISDNLLTNLAGIGAIGVAWFPTSAKDCISDNVRTFLSSGITGGIHYTFAGMFFGALALLCIVNFRRTQNSGFGRGEHSGLFLFCGIGIIVCMVLLGILALLGDTVQQKLAFLHPTWLLEAVMLVLFGISWLVKGEDKLTMFTLKMVGLKRTE